MVDQRPGKVGHFDPHFALQLLAKRGGVSYNVPLDALFLLLRNPIQSHLDHPCTSYLASKPIDTNSRPKVALASGSNI
jgi:hypothetical protein